jgi:hypothetical protein
MRTSVLFLTIPFVLFLSASQARPDDAATAAAIVDQAIKAHGGQEQLEKTQLMTRSARGTTSFIDKDVPFTDEWIRQLPDRWRQTVQVGPPGQQTQVLVVINGDKGWQSASGQVAELEKPRLTALREEGYLHWLATLIPLKKDNAFTLASLPDARVGDQDTAVVKVSRQGHADARLYFDKQTHLLVKAEHRARDAGLVVTKEYAYSDFKDFDGVKLPTKSVELTDGKKMTEVSEFTYKFLSRVDDNQFTRP